MDSTQATTGLPCVNNARSISLRPVRLAFGFFVLLLASSQTFAQYGGGGGMGGTGTGSGSAGPGYIPPKGGYGSGAAIGAGLGAAAGAGVLFFALRHHGAITGCVQRSEDGFSVVDEKKNKSYALVPGSIDLKPGERVQLIGKKSSDERGMTSFQARKMVKDLGACRVEAAASSKP